MAHLISEYQKSDHPGMHPIVLGVERPENGELIGHVGLSSFRDGVEIGFAIEDAQKRKGYATAAVSAMCTWAAREFSLNQIFGYVARENEASQRVLLRSGFRRVCREQRAEPCFHEMRVGRQGVDEAQFAHHDETRAIGE